MSGLLAALLALVALPVHFAMGSDSVFARYQVISLEDLRLQNTARIAGHAASNGNISISHEAEICGDATPGPGKRADAGSVCSGFSTTPATEPIVMSPIDQGNAPTVNDNGRIGSLDRWSSRGGSRWNPATRELSLSNDATLTLSGNVYSFCSLSLENDSRLVIAVRDPSNPLRIYMDAPENCPGVGDAGSVDLKNEATIANANLNPAAFQLHLVGSPTIETEVEFENSFSNSLSMALCAPRSEVLFQNSADILGAVAAKRVELKNSARITGDSRATCRQPASSTTPSASEPTTPSTGPTTPPTGPTTPSTDPTAPPTDPFPSTDPSTPPTGSTTPSTGSGSGSGSTTSSGGSTTLPTGSDPSTDPSTPSTGSSTPSTGSTTPSTGSTDPSGGSTPGGSSAPSTGSTAPANGSGNGSGNGSNGSDNGSGNASSGSGNPSNGSGNAANGSNPSSGSGGQSGNAPGSSSEGSSTSGGSGSGQSQPSSPGSDSTLTSTPPRSSEDSPGTTDDSPRKRPRTKNPGRGAPDEEGEEDDEFGDDEEFGVDLPGRTGRRYCGSKRRFRIRVRQSRRLQIKSATVYVNGKRAAVLKRKVFKRMRHTAEVDLRNLPRGRFTVRIVVVTMQGEVLEGKRKYRTCVPKRKKAKKAPKL